MNADSIRVAAGKTSDASALAALETIAALLDGMEQAQAQLPARLRAAKVQRGEPPVSLSPARQKQLAGLEADRLAGQARTAEQLKQFKDASTIVRILHRALFNSLPNARSALKHYHPSDVAFGEEIVARKEKICEAMADFLRQFPVVPDKPAGR
jgi:hypothetical protein